MSSSTRLNFRVVTALSGIGFPALPSAARVRTLPRLPPPVTPFGVSISIVISIEAAAAPANTSDAHAIL